MTPEPEVLRAVLDTKVLVPASLRDTLLRAAEADLYQPLWTDNILEELHRTLVRNQMTTPEGAVRLIAAMQTSFPVGTVLGHEPMIDQMPNDPKDRHVLAAAVSNGASTIVTLNVRHFRTHELSPYSVTAQTPDAFLSKLFDNSSGELIDILINQAASLRQPRTVADVLARIARFAPGFSQQVEDYRKSTMS